MQLMENKQGELEILMLLVNYSIMDAIVLVTVSMMDIGNFIGNDLCPSPHPNFLLLP